MTDYRFYFLIGTMIMGREDSECADDVEARAAADRRLGENGRTYDAIEVWEGARLVCRRDGAAR